MSRIHPASSANSGTKTFLAEKASVVGHEGVSPSLNELTVWKRSSMTFQGTDGFTVFDRSGRLAFRVENYSRTMSSFGEGGGLVLMDGAGNALLTLKPQMWSIRGQWNAYTEESYGCCSSRSGEIPAKLRLFLMRRSPRRLFSSSEVEAEVVLCGDAACRSRCRAPDFTIEGSFERRSCCIRSSSGEIVAKIYRKRVKNGGGIVLENDVFSLAIKPGFDAKMVMGFVVVLDRIRRKSYGPILCH
ncbi:hypothetical protein SAY87_023859 [Trapa incisa]|uniref:Protein LURP-one-related 5-like n=1 Tax=Trapa incisa TaxID=236973 RepID=A0AAN7L464_9MYRT|nr:hypothetical protein SAY87_023859 [Trapa incisa]